MSVVVVGVGGVEGVAGGGGGRMKSAREVGGLGKCPAQWVPRL